MAQTKQRNPIDALAAVPSPRAWLLIAVLALAALFGAAYWLYSGLLPFLLALLLAYACDPLVTRLQKHGWSRTQAVGFLLAALGLLALAAMALVLPILVRDARDLVERLPLYTSNAIDRVLSQGQAWGLPMPERAEFIASAQARLQSVSAGLLSSGGSLLSSTLNLALIPIFFFFLLRDLPDLLHRILLLAPPRHRPMVQRLGAEVDRAFSGYIRGQATVSLILGLILAAGLSLLGLRYGLVIGLLAGLLNMVPYVGQAVGLALALVVAVVDFSSWGQLLAVPLIFGAMNFIEGTFITPRIVGEQVGLNPLEAMLAMVLGGSAFGLLGLVLAIPAAGIAKTLLGDLLALYRESQLYRGKAKPR